MIVSVSVEPVIDFTCGFHNSFLRCHPGKLRSVVLSIGRSCRYETVAIGQDWSVKGEGGKPDCIRFYNLGAEKDLSRRFARVVCEELNRESHVRSAGQSAGAVHLGARVVQSERRRRVATRPATGIRSGGRPSVPGSGTRFGRHRRRGPLL